MEMKKMMFHGKLMLLALTAVILSCEDGVGSRLGASKTGVWHIELDKSVVSLNTGKKVRLASSVVPADAANQAVRWVSSDSSIATVSDDGIVKGIAAGTAVISAVSADDPSIKADCTVTVALLPYFTKSDDGSFSTPDAITFRTLLTPDLPASATFPFGRRFINGGYEPERYITVPARFMIAETETTWALWKEVYDWATDSDRGNAVYTFANPGRMGGDNGANLVLTPLHPVTAVNWDDAMVWCNALTEYFNATNGTAADLECVYTCNGAIIRSSVDDALCNTAVQRSTAKGFRLPTTYEWEFAARYIGPTDPLPPSSDPAEEDENKIKRNYLLLDGYYYQDGGSSGLILWNGDFYTVTGKTSTAEVKSKKPNSFGLYDMSGNVAEWCFDLYEVPVTLNLKARILRGGGFRFSTDDTHDVGYENADHPYTIDTSYGFRLARNKD